MFRADLFFGGNRSAVKDSTFFQRIQADLKCAGLNSAQVYFEYILAWPAGLDRFFSTPDKGFSLSADTGFEQKFADKM